jgi:hypothetical protein
LTVDKIFQQPNVEKATLDLYLKVKPEATVKTVQIGVVVHQTALASDVLMLTTKQERNTTYEIDHPLTTRQATTTTTATVATTTTATTVATTTTGIPTTTSTTGGVPTTTDATTSNVATVPTTDGSTNDVSSTTTTATATTTSSSSSMATTVNGDIVARAIVFVAGTSVDDVKNIVFFLFISF